VKLLKSSYGTRLPWQVNAALILIAILTLIALVYFVTGLLGEPLLGNSAALGAQGDFIGGHLASILTSITLIVVILTSYLQIHHDRKFRLREHFLSGISVISSYEAHEPGTEQAMRLLDYLALVAFQLKDDELLLILNTVITREIRAKLEEIEKTGRREYPNAVAARHKIGAILEAHYTSAQSSESVPAA